MSLQATVNIRLENNIFDFINLFNNYQICSCTNGANVRCNFINSKARID